METITNAASKLGYGQSTNSSGEEPTSGRSGKGTAEDPYDAGNQTTTEPIADNAKPLSSTTPTIGKATNTNAQPTKTPENPKSGAFGTVEPSVSSDPASAAKPTQKQQGADRPQEHPSKKEAQALGEKRDKGEETLKGAEKNDEDSSEKSKKKGSGEKWVKSTGLAAEGGDFDAVNPGAGREADRILEQKGIHREEDDSSGPKFEPKTASADKGSKIDKVKEKLHIGKN